MSVVTERVMTRGVVFVHSAPAALCPHIGWALETVLGERLRLNWRAQPLGTKIVRTEFSWTGEAGTGAHLASSLRGCDGVRYEVVEEPSPGHDGSRWSHTPNLGIHHAWVSVNGDVVVNEDRIRAAMLAGDPESVRRQLDLALGTAWDRELDPFRHAGEGEPVRWLHRVS